MSDDEGQIDIDDDDAVLVEGGPLDEANMAMANGDGVLVTQLEAPVLVSEQDLDALFGEDEDEEDLDDDDLDLGDDDHDEVELDARLDHAFEIDEPAPVMSAAEKDRVAKLETAVQQLAGAEVTREQRKVRRKVTAASGGAGAIGVVPILLQLFGTLEVSPELASTLVAGAAALGALVAGWATPEREAPLPPQAAVDILSGN